MWRRPSVRATVCGAILLTVTSCATNSPASDFCLIYRPVYTSAQDTEETRLQVDENNAAFEALKSEEHTSELQSLMRISYAVFCLKKKNDSKYELNTNRRV